MKIGKRFNLLSVKEYLHYIENHKKYADFNALGLYRSILENEKLTLAEKILVRDFANKFFQKYFDFLQIKDPFTYIKLFILGESLTVADEKQLLNQIKVHQQKFLKNKRIKHRNFGIYSKHSCGYESCNYNGLMIEQNSFLTEHQMRFDSDKNRFSLKIKSERLKKVRKKERQKIKTIFIAENLNQDE